MKNLDETEHLIHTTTGLLNFLGDDFSIEKVREMSFENVLEHLLRNGAEITIQTHHKNIYLKSL